MPQTKRRNDKGKGKTKEQTSPEGEEAQQEKDEKHRRRSKGATANNVEKDMLAYALHICIRLPR
eukprot:16401939-Heterocapsa_arctica.AAC.1